MNEPARGSPCPFCHEVVDPRRLEDVRHVMTDAHRTRLAHYACAKGKPLCPRHRQCFLGDACPRCTVERDPFVQG
jgi:hypothetical protein